MALVWVWCRPGPGGRLPSSKIEPSVLWSSGAQRLFDHPVHKMRGLYWMAEEASYKKPCFIKSCSFFFCSGDRFGRRWCSFGKCRQMMETLFSLECNVCAVSCCWVSIGVQRDTRRQADDRVLQFLRLANKKMKIRIQLSYRISEWLMCALNESSQISIVKPTLIVVLAWYFSILIVC
jgi:hypothetical protein